MKKTVLSLLLAVVILMLSCLTSCEEEQDLESIARCKEEFAQYYSGVDRVAGDHAGKLYFQNHTITPKDIAEMAGSSMMLYNGAIYFLKHISSGEYRSESFDIYSCDVYGKNLQFIYSQPLYNSKLSENDYDIVGDTYYFEYKKDGIVFVDKYTISTGIHEQVGSGAKCSMYNYIKTPSERYIDDKYDVEIKKDQHIFELIHWIDIGAKKFVITDRETGEQRVIDDQYLENTIYKASMDKFGYYPTDATVYNGKHILLVYEVSIDAPAKLIFEYDFETDELNYLALLFPAGSWASTSYMYIEYPE